ncbi:hypothetical protein ACJ73_01767 [Blastomyces percursus]|uniref:Uncharacterized protein n=1 Tax=Blastomyces percursus TaxID=1658174 RepID=A0A1J9QDE2_9EURO|nr:hypothetical protein ACJ73_01767 [Blastomyces percursus]
MGILTNPPPQPDDLYTQQSPHDPPPQPDGRQTQPSSNECDFPELIISIELGSASAPNTQFSLDDVFYQLMDRWLVKHGNSCQTVSASHLTMAAHDARSAASEAGALIRDRFFQYLQDTCEENSKLRARKDSETLGDEELWCYAQCVLSFKLGMRGTMLVDGRGSYALNGRPQPIVFRSFVPCGEVRGLFYLDLHGEQRSYTLLFQSRDLSDLESLGIDLLHG